MNSPDLRDLRRLADLMDRRFKGPFGWRYGLDGLLGLIPVLGDMVTNAVSVYIILRAAQLGVSAAVILRMGLNLLVENVVDFIPLFGNLFDFVWTANTKNMVLIESYFANPVRTKRNSGFVVGFAIALVVALIACSIAASLAILRWFYLSIIEFPDWTI